jgi:hypothetical protein
VPTDYHETRITRILVQGVRRKFAAIERPAAPPARLHQPGFARLQVGSSNPRDPRPVRSTQMSAIIPPAVSRALAPTSAEVFEGIEKLVCSRKMPTRSLDDQIDRLYQLPLDEFTSARNALAKEVGKDGAEVRLLPKPPLPAWSINQVYWTERPIYEALAAAASSLREAHGAVLAGKRADLRAAGQAHEEALDGVLKKALAVLADAGHPASDATKQAIASTLRALPGAEDRPGRLARTLQPGGFEMLAGLPLAPSRVPGRREPAAESASAIGRKAAREQSDADRKKQVEARGRAEPAREKKDVQRAAALAKAREAVAAAARLERTAEQTASREEFEAARATREAERAEARVAEARSAFEAAREALTEAEREAAAAARKKEAAARRVRETADALARARVRTESAQADLARLE